MTKYEGWFGLLISYPIWSEWTSKHIFQHICEWHDRVDNLKLGAGSGDGMQDPLQWRHNECDGVSNHQPHDYLLNRLFHVTGLCVENSPITGEFPAQRASNAENVAITYPFRSDNTSLTNLLQPTYYKWYGMLGKYFQWRWGCLGLCM